MNKRNVLTIVLPSLLLAPAILAHNVAAEELAGQANDVVTPVVVNSPVSENQKEVTNEKVASRPETNLDENLSFLQGEQSSTQSSEENATNDDTPPLEANRSETERNSDASVSISEKTETEALPKLEEVQDAKLAVGNVPATGKDIIHYTGSLTDSSLKDKSLTIQDTVSELLKWAAVDPSQLGNTPADHISFAKSLGMIGSTVDPTTQAKSEDVAGMYTVAKKLYDAYRATKKQPLILNGKTQPIFPFTSGAKLTDYDYEKSDIVRFVVYVETDYDTDGDGKRDLVKAFVQLPKAVAEGNYKAATIYEASPYVAGTTGKTKLKGLGLPDNGSYDMSSLYRQPDKRVSVGSMTTIEAAKAAKSSDWYYKNPNESTEDYTHYDYENIDLYNYFLVRGYAVVTSSGLGSYQSEGLNTVGSDIEVAGYKSVIEWLTGKRVAYTDKTSNIEIKADWSNGSVGMQGLSWAGTTTFGVASTGVEGLKTIVPASGIASWYEYLNSQGTSFKNRNLSYLSIYVSNRFVDPADWDTIKERYANYISQLNKDQHAHRDNYSDVWANRDYTKNADKIKASAFIIHGLNDNNVRTKHFELMYNAFKQAGQNVKLFLHQADHVLPITPWYGTKVGDVNFYEILNDWYSHYLYNVDNNVENLPTVTASNNYDPSKWQTYNDWESPNKLTIQALSKRAEETINSDYAAANIDTKERDKYVSQVSSTANLNFQIDVPEDTTIKGSVPVHFQAALSQKPQKDEKNYQVNVQLVDIADEDFDVATETIRFDGNGHKVKEMPVKEISRDTYWLGSNLKNVQENQTGTNKTKYKVIGNGWINLANPESAYASETSRNSIDPQIGEFHDYTVYLQPTVYTVKKGHRLALVFNTYDSNLTRSRETYAVTFRPNSIKAIVPIVEAARFVSANYVPNAMDTDYANLENVTPVAPVESVEHSVVNKDNHDANTSETVFVFVQYGTKQEEATPVMESEKTLPQTGSKENLGLFAMAAVSLLTAFGLKRWSKKED
ncbi:MAG: CocE/NonD family hydrolase [Streptococcus sp.]|nr:CocE/NonD family hydrolase [Streptococcus sp.]